LFYEVAIIFLLLAPDHSSLTANKNWRLPYVVNDW